MAAPAPEQLAFDFEGDTGRGRNGVDRTTSPASTASLQQDKPAGPNDADQLRLSVAPTNVARSLVDTHSARDFPPLLRCLGRGRSPPRPAAL
jgi:hypothetical protein